MMTSLTVDLGDRSYPVYIGTGLIGRGELIDPHLRGRQVLVVTDENVAPLYLPAVLSGLAARDAKSLVLASGEETKSWVALNSIFDQLLAARFNRQCTLVALGGGVVGDIAGFAAACYQRGVSYIQLPTTLLAQVDSSVGGKTAINHPAGKNMIGAFHQPACVIADVSTLDTLDERQVRAGIAEVIKYGVLGDLAFLEWLEQHAAELVARDAEALGHAVRRSCEIKAAIVGSDEREAGRRALLNLGHTFGHAIEAGTGYTQWLHGEAVAAGICLAADLSARAGLLSREAVHRIERLFQRLQLPTRAPKEVEPKRMLELMAVDKKAVDEGLRLVLLRSLGDAFVTGSFSREALRDTLESCRATS